MSRCGGFDRDREAGPGTSPDRRVLAGGYSWSWGAPNMPGGDLWVIEARGDGPSNLIVIAHCADVTY
jgi:hypothetical protein